VDRQKLRIIRWALPVAMRSASRTRDLEGLATGVPAFVVGNGRSRLAYDLRTLWDDGLNFYCNSGGLERDVVVDVHVWNDGAFNRKMVAQGHLHHSRMCLTDTSNAKFWRRSSATIQPFFYPLDVSQSQTPPFYKIAASCTGNHALQLAHLMGCSPIYLIGFDYCYDGASSNVYKDAHADFPRVTANGVVTDDRLISWAAETLRITRAIQEHGLTLVRRVGSYDGLLGEIPAVSWDSWSRR